MKLKAITLQNCRQFYGTQSLDFSLDPVKNVTLIHAENGVGKTNLINSFFWALYGKTSVPFEQSHLIINNEALAEEKKMCLGFLSNFPMMVTTLWFAEP
jgi:DNA sulfur modification protein DndD